MHLFYFPHLLIIASTFQGIFIIIVVIITTTTTTTTINLVGYDITTVRTHLQLMPRSRKCWSIHPSLMSS
jgi:hypothetical protein